MLLTAATNGPHRRSIHIAIAGFIFQNTGSSCAMDGVERGWVHGYVARLVSTFFQPCPCVPMVGYVSPLGGMSRS